MLRFDGILVALDFAEPSLAAVRHGCALAGESSVRLLHVLDEGTLPHSIFLGREQREALARDREEEARLEIVELARELESNGSRVSTEVRRGRPADEIVAASHAASLVVVGSHGRGLNELLLGSVAEEVATRSAAPVLIAREGAEGASLPRRVLLALDLAEPSLEAVSAAQDLATRAGALLEVLCAVPWPRSSRRPGDDERAVIVANAEREAKAILAKALGAPAVHVAIGAPADEVVCAARPDDTIVCGTHGRGRLGRLVFGSVMRSIARRAPCPVLAVPRLRS